MSRLTRERLADAAFAVALGLAMFVALGWAICPTCLAP